MTKTANVRNERVTTIAVRSDLKDKWVAVISCRASDKIQTPVDLHKAILVAVQAWVNKTQAGKEAFEESSQDFNIGDLSNNLDSYSLRDELMDVGVTQLQISLFDDSGDFWDYDEVLAVEPEEIEQDA